MARRAGVGIGTLYRHFPSREALCEAVYRHEVEQLVELARYLEAETAPVEALRRWLQAGVEFMATKKVMAAALAMAAQGSPDLVAYSLDRLTRAVGGTAAARGGGGGRHRCRGPASNSGRYVLRLRPDGLATQGPALDRCLRRRTTPPATQHDDLHLWQSVVAPTAAPARDARRSETVHSQAGLGVTEGVKKGPLLVDTDMKSPSRRVAA